MVGPETYTAYDKDGNVIGTYTAEDTNNYINPSEVKAALDNLKTVFQEQMKNIARALNDIELDAGDAIIVQGTKMDEEIREMAQAISSDVPTQALNGIDTLYDTAVSAHDKIQQQLNEQAKSAAQAAAGSGGKLG